MNESDNARCQEIIVEHKALVSKMVDTFNYDLREILKAKFDKLADEFEKFILMEN